LKAETKNILAGERDRRAEGEKRTLGVPRIQEDSGSPYPEAFGVNLWRSSPASFTLVELLTVLVIVAILAGLIVGGAKYAVTKAATSRAQAEIAAMELALEKYKNDNGTYPASTATRASASPPGNWTSVEINNSIKLYSALSGKYFTFKPNQVRVDTTTKLLYVVDPFGAPYNYYFPPATATPAIAWKNQPSFDLWSYGANGINDEGTNDDIGNWQPH
jgi:general secretion pathway protein G